MKRLVLFVAVVALLCSCSAINRNNRNIVNLKVSMTQDEVVTIMGTPQSSESYEAVGGERIAILYYQTEEKSTTVISAKDECTPLVFVNGKLTGWGDRLITSNINMLRAKTK
jgi:predicted secreted protein